MRSFEHAVVGMVVIVRHSPAVPAAVSSDAGGLAPAAGSGLRQAHAEEPERTARLLPVRRRRASSRRCSRSPPPEEPDRVPGVPNQVSSSSNSLFVSLFFGFLWLLPLPALWKCGWGR